MVQIVEVRRIEYTEKEAVNVDQRNAGCSVVVATVAREAERVMPDEAFVGKFQRKVGAHFALHPNGILPSELRRFHTYLKNKNKYLNAEEMMVLRLFFAVTPRRLWKLLYQALDRARF